MSVYHKFEDYDLLYSLISASPRIIMTSGTAGWRGNVGASSSLSLYEGVRGRNDVFAGSGHGVEVYPLDAVDTHSIDRVIYVSGSYPSTGSVHFVKCRKKNIEDLSAIDPFLYNKSTLITADDWYKEHFDPIVLSFDYYNRFNTQYFTGSYDYYSLYFKRYSYPDVYAATSSFVAVTNRSNIMFTGSHTLQVWFKPLLTSFTGSDNQLGNEHATLVAKDNTYWRVFMTGSSGTIAFSDNENAVVVSSIVPQKGVWQHLSVVVASGSAASASFYYNGVLAATASHSVAAHPGTSASVDNFYVGADLGILQLSSGGKGGSGYEGFIFDVRTWNRALSSADISASYNTSVFNSGSADLPIYLRFNDGPLSTRHGFSMGSGAFNYSPVLDPSGTVAQGQFMNFQARLPAVPLWQPNDNPNYVTTKTSIDDEVTMLRVLHVPSMFYGRQIATGSIRMECHAYSNQGLIRVLVDDGRGSLYLSGSICRAISGEEYGGVTWRKVGNVFYSEGLVVLTDPSLLDFGSINLDTAKPNDTLQVSFSGLERISTRTFMCRVPAGEANASSNPTFSSLNDDTGKHEINNPGRDTWITAVGLYDDEHRLVAVAKLAQPIRKRGKLDIRLRFDM